MDHLELARLHVAALYEFDDVGRIAGVRAADPPPRPRFALMRTAEGTLALVSASVPAAIADDLLALAASEPPLADPETPPAHDQAYRRALTAHRPIVRAYQGPAFVLPPGIEPPAGVSRVDESNADALVRHFGWLHRLPSEEMPVWAALEDGVAVAACWSSRYPGPATHAGVLTVEGHRGRGHARACTAGWAFDIASAGQLPLYSTTWDNTASRRIAARLGGVMFGVDYSLA